MGEILEQLGMPLKGIKIYKLLIEFNGKCQKCKLGTLES
jgi:hypothetical protein